MRVVLTVGGTAGYGGLLKYFYLLARHLALNHIDVEVIVDSSDGQAKLYEVTQGIVDVPLPQTKVIGPTVTGIVSKALFVYNIAKYLKNKDFDILHSCDVFPYFYLMQKDRKPVVFQPFSNELFQVGGRDIRRLFFFVLRSCGRKADALAIIGEWQMDWMIKGYSINKDRTFILPVGIDISFIKDKAGQRDVTREQMSISEDTFVVLSVNTFHPYKGIEYLIKAFRDVPKALLVLIGAGPEERNLRRLVFELGLQDQVVFTGGVEEKSLYNYYAVADVFVSPTMLQGSSMSIMEAEVFGLPIVSTHQEFLIDGNGYVVPEKNPKALAEGILKVRNGDRLKMGERSKGIVKQYDFKEIAKTAIGKYEELIR